MFGVAPIQIINGNPIDRIYWVLASSGALWPGERERTESFGWDHHFAEFYSQTTAARYIFNVTDCERRRIGFMAGEKPF